MARSLTRREDWPMDWVGVRRAGGQLLPHCLRRRKTALNWSLAEDPGANPMACAATGLCQRVAGMNGSTFSSSIREKTAPGKGSSPASAASLSGGLGLGHVTEGGENRELHAQLSQAVMAVIHGCKTPLASGFLATGAPWKQISGSTLTSSGQAVIRAQKKRQTYLCQLSRRGRLLSSRRRSSQSGCKEWSNATNSSPWVVTRRWASSCRTM
jgi:hypothetical protein